MLLAYCTVLLLAALTTMDAAPALRQAALDDSKRGGVASGLSGNFHQSLHPMFHRAAALDKREWDTGSKSIDSSKVVHKLKDQEKATVQKKALLKKSHSDKDVQQSRGLQTTDKKKGYPPYTYYTYDPPSYYYYYYYGQDDKKDKKHLATGHAPSKAHTRRGLNKHALKAKTLDKADKKGYPPWYSYTYEPPSYYYPYTYYYYYGQDDKKDRKNLASGHAPNKAHNRRGLNKHALKAKESQLMQALKRYLQDPNDVKK